MKKPNFHQNEQGSAILIVLGLLTLVLVLALVFLANSRNARAIATAGADYAKAGLVAESAVARVQAVSYYTQSVIMDNIPPDGDVNGLVYDHQPYAGSFMVNDALTDAASAASGTEKYRQVRVQHLKGKNSGGAADTTQNGYVLYTHDKNNKNGADHVVYNFMASTNYGKYLSVATANFQNSLGKTNGYNSNFTYQNILDADGHVQSRYAFLMIPEGPKFNVNRMVLAGGDGVNVIPEVKNGELAEPAECDPDAFTIANLQSSNHSFFAITGYEYTDPVDPGKITGLKNNGAYDEGDTLQYGLHPQELRIAENVKDLADNLELNDDDKPPQWFNYDNLLAKNKVLWDSGTNLRYFWSLYTIESGLDDREVLYHGNEANIEECSNNSPKINLAYPMQTSWDTISATLSSALAGGASVSDLLSSNFQNTLGNALYSDTESHVLFKDDDGNDITPAVFANLVDFCDSDSFVTYEATVGTGAAAQRLKFDTDENDISDVDIKICGNEKTPAVIGVGLEVTNCNRTITNSTINGQQVWSSSGSGVTDARVRVVLQNYFNDPVDLPKQVRVVIRGKANPWCAGVRTDAGGTTYWLYDRTTSQQILNYGTSNDELDAVLAGIDFSVHAKEFVVDQTVSLSGSLNAREVDDTSVDVELKASNGNPAFDAQCSQANNVLGKIERSGYWLKVTDILVMTADEITDPNTSLTTTKVMDLVYADGDDHTILWRRNDKNLAWTGNHLVAWAAAQDPRCNHRDWKWFNDSVSGVSGWNWSTNSDNGYVTIGLIKNGSFGIQDKLRKAALALIQSYCKNTSFATGGGSTPVTYATKDLEPELNLIVSASNAVAQTPNTFSTAFIPNAPITSLWQLGAVSRGVPAQTINLKKYGGPKGGQKYEDGDAWLLDYLKLNELKADSPFPGKFNPNCFYARAYRYLLANIPANPDPNDTAVYQPGRLSMSDIKRNKFYYDMIKQEGTPIELEYYYSGVRPPEYWDNNNYRNYTGLFIFNPRLNFEVNGNDANLSPQQAPKQSWSPVEAFFNFVEILNTPKYKVSGSTKNANDRMAESLIGCTAGLLSTRYEFFTVFAVGQNVKWLGAEFDAMNTADRNAIIDQMMNPIQIHNGTAANWYSILSTQMRQMTIQRDCWFNTLKVVRTYLY